jgi:hypothetical protein
MGESSGAWREKSRAKKADISKKQNMEREGEIDNQSIMGRGRGSSFFPWREIEVIHGKGLVAP